MNKKLQKEKRNLKELEQIMSLIEKKERICLEMLYVRGADTCPECLKRTLISFTTEVLIDETKTITGSVGSEYCVFYCVHYFYSRSGIRKIHRK